VAPFSPKPVILLLTPSYIPPLLLVEDGATPLVCILVFLDIEIVGISDDSKELEPHLPPALGAWVSRPVHLSADKLAFFVKFLMPFGGIFVGKTIIFESPKFLGVLYLSWFIELQVIFVCHIVICLIEYVRLFMASWS